MKDVELLHYEQMADAVWQRLIAAADRREPQFRLMAVASVAEGHQPDVRLLVLRGADRAQGVLWFYSDARAAKIAQFRLTPQAVVLAYDQAIGLQVRLRGNVAIHIADSRSRKHWEQLDLAARYEFGIAPAPGQPVAREDPLRRHHHSRIRTGETERGFDRFAVLRFTIESIDVLQVSDLGDRRALMMREQDWLAVPIAP